MVIDEQVWERFRNRTATEEDLLAIQADYDNEAGVRCPDFEAFMNPLLWQIKRMEEGATMADALEALANA